MGMPEIPWRVYDDETPALLPSDIESEIIRKLAVRAGCEWSIAKEVLERVKGSETAAEKVIMGAKSINVDPLSLCVMWEAGYRDGQVLAKRRGGK
jgi:hypothetical protein